MVEITIELDDETYHRVQAKAAERGLSVSTLVNSFLAEFAGETPDERFARLLRMEEEARTRITDFDASDRRYRAPGWWAEQAKVPPALADGKPPEGGGTPNQDPHGRSSFMTDRMSRDELHDRRL